ncbi:hypothetical protein HY407_02055 [Candidatus Gottesmanbacteria bacterium]|nr:hypothetical protein [Candidatus Gottesmanbacteria bacterium]
MKKLLFTTAIFLIFWLALIDHSFAQKSIKFGQFTPTSSASPPPAGNNIECTIGLAEEVITRYRNANLLTAMENSQRQFLACDVYTYIGGCNGPSFVECSKGCYSYRGSQAQSVLTNPQVAPQISDFYDINSTLFQSYWIYTKAVGRFGLRNGFGLTTAGKDEMAATLQAMTCAERVGQLEHHIETPLYFYPLEKTALDVTLPDQSTVHLEALPDGTFNIQNQTYSSLAYNLKKTTYTPPEKGRIIDGSNLKQELQKIADELHLKTTEKSDFLSYWQQSLPQSPFYFVSLFPESEALKLTGWHIKPPPDSEIRYLFYFKPLTKKPTLNYSYHFTPIPRSGFTVLDWGGTIDW